MRKDEEDEENRPTTSRKIPNPSPDTYCDYVIPSNRKDNNNRSEIINGISFFLINQRI